MRKPLKWIGITLGGLVAIALMAAVAIALVGRSRMNATYQAPRMIEPNAVSSASAETGRRIALTRGCVECHGETFAGKVFLDIPPGRILAPNLTSGRGGVGSRYASIEDWDRAVRFGIRPDGSVLVPFMPWEVYNRLTDEDGASLAAYLASLPPADSELPPLQLRPLGYIIMGLPDMNPNTVQARLAAAERPAVTPGPTAAYGRYIASTTCVVCHGEDLRGGDHPDPSGPPGPGLGHAGMWSLADFTSMMRTGVVPGGRQLSNWMPWQFFRHFTDEEIAAVHEYLKTIPPGSAAGTS